MGDELSVNRRFFDFESKLMFFKQRLDGEISSKNDDNKIKSCFSFQNFIFSCLPLFEREAAITVLRDSSCWNSAKNVQRY